MRTRETYIETLRDGRQVMLDGAPVEDVTRHPAFERQVARIAELYERAHDSANQRLWYREPTSGRQHSAMWLVPKSADDLKRRRELHTFWAEGTYGLMGRTPDHVASFLVAFVGSLSVLERGGNELARNVVRFYERVRNEDAYVSYAIVPPQVDRSRAPHEQRDATLYAGVVAERDGGIIVRGAQMIGTAAPLANYLFISHITPLKPGDEDYAIAVALPVNAPGLRIYPRRPYATAATSVFDYPLSAQFDETDSVIVLDDVFVPWEDVFIYRDIDLVNAQFFETGAHVMGNFQSLVRFVVKLHFACGLARKLAEVHGIESAPPVQAHLGGRLATVCLALEAILLAAEASSLDRDGLTWPHPGYVYGGMSLQRRLVVDVMRDIRELAGGSFIAVPSSVQSFMSAATREDTERYYQGARSTARERVKLLKLLWDLVGTEFGGRQLQYEMFYSAAQHVVDSRVYETFEWDRGLELANACLGEYSIGNEELPEVSSAIDQRGRGVASQPT
jgi:4-hydroxyphenylacetate 3-monooxygenase